MDHLVNTYEADVLEPAPSRPRRTSAAAEERQRLFSTLQQVAQEQRQNETASVAAPAGTPAGDGAAPERLTIKSQGRTFQVTVADIDYIESAANYVRLYVGGENHRVRGKISDFAAQLDPRQFVRIHRTTIVNLSRVREIQPWFSGDALVYLLNGTKLRLSRFYRSAIAGRFIGPAD